MRATQIVRRLCASCLEHVHASRFKAVLRAVEGIILAQRLSLTAIGRALRGDLQPRHGIKMVDRLLGNTKLGKERAHWYAAIAKRITGSERRLVVLLDWTQLHGEFWALVAAVAFEGRAVPILAEAHHESQLGSRDVQTRFLEELRRVLPAKCKPLIVADGGFRSPFFEACREARIDFVVRLRNEHGMAKFARRIRGHGGWTSIKFGEIFRWARSSAQCLGRGVPFCKSAHREECRLVLGAAPKKFRKRGRYAGDYERKRATEPWLLATSLQNEPAEAVVAIYAKRMQVEECFRDTKNARFGWGLEFTATRSTARLNVLLLLASIAFAAVILVGAAASNGGIEKRFRASSLNKRVLSLFSLGNLVARSTALVRMRIQDVWNHLAALRRVSRELIPPVPQLRRDDRHPHSWISHDHFCANCGWNSHLPQ
ncbi:MAG TPA: IS4 family transposase [Gemmatimonadaceae bacterium]|nr:IS4 family transposase [Gemmatimonadaceae bacterium]